MPRAGPNISTHGGAVGGVLQRLIGTAGKHKPHPGVRKGLGRRQPRRAWGAGHGLELVWSDHVERRRTHRSMLAIDACG